MKPSLKGILILVAVLGALVLQRLVPHPAPGARAPEVPAVPAVPAPAAPAPADLPPEARETLAKIRAGGPFAHRQDGAVFQNREGRLPARPLGYYHEYTVETPGADDRGARRLVTGGDPPAEIFYSDDHYRSFRRITP